ncbi:MAG: hypothetical protein BWX52_01943 [Bacteroidetes bacterium ADurb.Bin013]|nr:MAG: hypothetical protein BWX52_01943 [Bacteroidetes bacterium ADurb.Bin013]
MGVCFGKKFHMPCTGELLEGFKCRGGKLLHLFQGDPAYGIGDPEGSVEFLDQIQYDPVGRDVTS